MADELFLRLVATPTLRIPNIGLGDLSDRSENQRANVLAHASVAQRRDWERNGYAMRDGAFPIPNVPALRTALQAYGFAENKPAARRFIIRRARALSRTDVLPDPWREHAEAVSHEEDRPMTETIAASAAAGWSDTHEFYWNPDTDETYRIDENNVVEAFAGEEWAASEVAPDDVRFLVAVDDAETLQTIVAAAGTDSRAIDALPDGAGRRFRIPIVIPEGVPSGDKRSFTKDALEYKEPPIPLLWQKTTDEGHKGSVTVGKITQIERIEGGLGNAEGVFDTHDDALEAARQVRERFLTGVSGDVDQFEAELSENDEGEEKMEIRHGRLVAATLVAKPAFQEATIEFIAEPNDTPVILASAGPLQPPRAWFTDPKLSQPTRLDVTDDGRVFGHIAEWNTPHMGNPALRPPRSRTKYSEFNSRPLRVADGGDIKVGQLTLVGGHADLDLPVERVIAHYDNTQSAVADVIAGEDEFGIWVAGAMRPTVSDEQVRAFRASDPSGDWRMRNGNLELVAVCQVNTPGFPVARTLVASGQPMALVAAGVAGLSKRDDRTSAGIIAALESRIALLEDERKAEKAAAAKSQIESLRH